MKQLKIDEMVCVHGGELECTETAVAYFEDEGRKCMKIFVALKGDQQDFDKLVDQLNIVK